MELLPFQIEASTQIAERFVQYIQNPLHGKGGRLIPFYQNLSGLTGSGKTLILADAVAEMRDRLNSQPIVLWLSKSRPVVWQTYANLSTGKYAHLLRDFQVKPLHECRPSDLERTEDGLVLVATVGKFNQKDKEQGDRRIFQIEWDKAEESLWNQLKTRLDAEGQRRPIFIVYDESHNLSNQQTELLLELEPDALLLASATMRVPESLLKIVTRLREDMEWREDDLVTAVSHVQVVQSGLIKRSLLLGGYVTPMEAAIDDLIDQMGVLEQAAKELNLPFLPKSIYVSQTNMVSGSEKDEIKAPFHLRMARPILIWRYLVEQKGVNPADIAVYCNLKFHPKFQPPEEFVLFSGGESDFEDFRAGNYRHIIFNLTLQEGWDDPACYLAYIDKDMGSKDQVTQVIGRVLRQPGAEHYAAQELNTAHFYIRTDEKSVFEDVLTEVEAKIVGEMPEVALTFYHSGSGQPKPVLPARYECYLPQISIDSSSAHLPICGLVERVPDYQIDSVNTVGKGMRMQVRQTIGSGEQAREEWTPVAHSNRVTARWVFLRAIQKQYGQAAHHCDTSDPKFNALVDYQSIAAEQIRSMADQVVKTYLEHAKVVQSNMNEIQVGSMVSYGNDPISFRHSVHERYGGLNQLEKRFAHAIDKTGHRWLRNPPQGFFEIPLLDLGGTKHFNPDFLVWTEQQLVAIDTKGDHLIRQDAARKLFFVENTGSGPSLAIRLVTEGKWRANFEKEEYHGFTVWLIKNGRIHPMHAKNVQEAVQICLQNS